MPAKTIVMYKLITCIVLILVCISCVDKSKKGTSTGDDNPKAIRPGPTDPNLPPRLCWDTIHLAPSPKYGCDSTITKRVVFPCDPGPIAHFITGGKPLPGGGGPRFGIAPDSCYKADKKIVTLASTFSIEVPCNMLPNISTWINDSIYSGTSINKVTMFIKIFEDGNKIDHEDSSIVTYVDDFYVEDNQFITYDHYRPVCDKNGTVKCKTNVLREFSFEVNTEHLIGNKFSNYHIVFGIEDYGEHFHPTDTLLHEHKDTSILNPCSGISKDKLDYYNCIDTSGLHEADHVIIQSAPRICSRGFVFIDSLPPSKIDTIIHN